MEQIVYSNVKYFSMKKLIAGAVILLTSIMLMSGCIAPTNYRVAPTTGHQQIIIIKEYPVYYYPYPITGWRFDVGWRSGYHRRR